MHAEPVAGPRDVPRDPLVHELPRVHAGDGQHVGEAALQLRQLGDHVLAVDAPVGPEVEQQDAPAEVRQRELPPARVDPLQLRPEVRRAYRHLTSSFQDRREIGTELRAAGDGAQEADSERSRSGFVIRAVDGFR
jgi:hypothetical protein